MSNTCYFGLFVRLEHGVPGTRKVRQYTLSRDWRQMRAGRRRKPCPFNVWLVLNWICRRHHHFADTCWQKNKSADIGWHLLTVDDEKDFFKFKIYVYADICWHLLPRFADIFWPLLNLAGASDATIFWKGSNHTGRSLAGAHILRVSSLKPCPLGFSKIEVSKFRSFITNSFMTQLRFLSS